MSPANFMPTFARNNGAKVIFVNRDSTYMDEAADIFLKGSASKIFTKLLKKVKNHEKEA